MMNNTDSRETIVVDKTNCNNKHMCGVKCISWSAIFVGAFIAIGLTFLLNLFGLGIGLSAFTTNKEGMTILAFGGYIGMVLSVIVAMSVAGWATGYMARSHCSNRHLGALYGFVMWSVALILTALLMTNVNKFISLSSHSLYGTHTAAVNLDADSMTPAAQPKKNLAETVVSSREVTPKTEKATNQLGQAILLSFILFFVGALSSCMGAFFGLKSCCTSCGKRHCNCSSKNCGDKVCSYCGKSNCNCPQKAL